ncbi:hypothetical protein PspLS_06301 [Pyricularia sp. CBS 133598]|nr:hypothetical protein PspLS_06301 [Pyricularia sp. CBS 133598]
MTTNQMLFQLDRFPGAEAGSRSVNVLTKSFELQGQRARESSRCENVLEAAWCLTLRLYSGSDNVAFHSYPAGEGSRFRTYEFSHDQHEKLEDVRRAFQETASSSKHQDQGSNVGFCSAFNAVGGHVPDENLDLVFGGVEALTLQFCESFMSIEEAGNMLETMAHVLESLSLHPDTTVAQLGPSPRDVAAITVWNRTPLTVRNVLVHEEFARVARCSPSRPALHSWDGEMTYAELDRASDALARRLLDQGCGPGRWVLLCFNKTRWAVVAMLAVMKAGAASVPLDPRYPPDRVRQIIENTGAEMALVGGQGKVRFSAVVSGTGSAVNVIDVDDTTVEAAPTSSSLPRNVSPQDPAYCIFTSGSTGIPKGVVFTHAGIASSTRTYKSIVGADEATRILQFSAFVFDVSVAEIFTALLHGSTLCIPSEDDRVGDLQGFMERARPTWIALTPTVARVLDPEAAARCGVAKLLLVGELVKQADVSGWIDARVRVYNVYGPAENTLVTTVAQLHKGRAISVGRGANTRIWVADVDRGRLLPVGAVGELVVEGPHVSPGYLNDPERTARGFLRGLDWIPDPISGTPGGDRAFYRTGDLVRFAADGELHCIGRSDSQVKLGGQRVELGDIETHLQRHAVSAKGAAVVVPKQGSFANRLTAVVQVQQRSGLASDDGSFQSLDPDLTVEISTHMRSCVPEYMIPVVWLTTKDLPVSTSGKLDRRTLTTKLEQMSPEEAARARGLEQMDESRVELSDSPSSVLAQVCSRVLNLPVGSVSLDRSFISLGGDSISAMQLSSLARRSFGFTIKVSELMTSPRLTDVVAKMQAVDAMPSTALALPDVEIGARYNLSPIQQLFMETAKTTEARNHYHQSTFLRLSRNLAVGVLEAAIHDLVRCHAMLRARFQKDPRSGGWQQYLLSQQEPGSLPALQQFDRVDSEDEMRSLADGARASLDVENGPIMRVLLMTESSGRQLLFFVVHHLVVDLVSWRVLLDELETRLRNDSADADADPDPGADSALSTPFLAWSQLQERDSARLQPQNTIPSRPLVPCADFDYWGITCPATQNIFRHVVEKRSALAGSVAACIFNPATHVALGTDPVDIFLSAILVSFSRVFRDRPPPPIFNEGHGREPKEHDGVDITRTVGWFTTMYPVCVGSTDCSLVDLVRQVKDYRHGISRNGLDYFSAKYLHSSGKRAFASHIPSEIMFNYEGRYQNLERDDSILRPEMKLWQAGEDLADQAKNLQRFCLFEISAAVLPDGQLHLTSAWNTTTRHQDLVQMWLQMLLPAAMAEVAAALRAERPHLTLWDMRLARGVETYADVDRIAQRLLQCPEVASGADIQAIYEGSPMQDALAMSLSRSHHDGAYEITYIWELVGGSGGGIEIDPARIKSAWEATVARHPLLRTVFVESNTGMVLQTVLQSHKPECKVLSAVDKAAAVSTLMNLGRPDWKVFESPRPLHRVTICTTSQSQSQSQSQVILRLDIHHIIFDGMSKIPLLADIMAGCAGKLVDKPVVGSSTFANFVHHHKCEHRKAASVRYWQSFLSDVRPCLFPKSPQQYPEADADVGAEAQAEATRGACDIVTSATMAQINALSIRSGSALASIIQLTWALVLSLYTGSQRPVFGFMASGRDAPVDGIEESIGPYAVLLANAIDVGKAVGQTVAEALAAVQLSITSAMGHQSITLGEMHNALGLSGTSYLFNTGVAMEQRHTRVQDGDMTIQEICAHDPTEFDLSLVVDTTSSDFAMRLEYRTGSISHHHADNIAATTAHVLEKLLSNHDLPIGTLCDGPSGRDQRQIWDWNAELISPATECLDQMFLSAVAQHPERQAIEAWDGSMTYAELGQAATKLAGYLKTLGVGPETPVPLCFEKSIWPIVAVQAVLLAGGYFVMLDPTQTDARLSVIMAELDARLLLCSPLASKSKDFASLAKKPLSDVVVVVEIGPEFLASLPPPPPTQPHQQKSTPDTTAYVVFTSGSTGIPKGVAVTHSALRTGLGEFAAACAMPPAVRALQFASFTFDASLADIFLAVIRGGCLCVPADQMRNAVDIADFMTRTGANWAGITPSMASLIDPASVPTLKALTLSGESLSAAEIDRWAGKVALTNMYGPSECSIACVANTRLGRGASSSNIGRGFRCATWIVDENNHHRLVPIGAVGELLIEGPALARGYLNNPELTARVFISSPPWLAAQRPKSRLYKTGDLVHYNADGAITFVGRKDAQIKINGQRVETGEIENGLRRMLDPGENVVFYIVDVPQPRGRGHDHDHNRDRDHNPILVAFVSFADAHGVGVLRDESHLQRLGSLVAKVMDAWGAGSTTLTSYMLPQAFVPIGRAPMMSSGKVDRRALRNAVAGMTRAELVSFASGKEGGGAKPRGLGRFAGPTEELLAKLWEQVLQVDSVDRNSHFVRLGGNSIAAIKLRGEAWRRKLDLSVSDIFSCPVLADMAQLLQHKAPVSVAPSPSLSPVSIDNPWAFATTDQQHTEGSTPGHVQDALLQDQLDTMLPQSYSPFELVGSDPSRDDLLTRVATECEISPHHVEDVFPCTPVQEGLMTSTLLSPGGAAYVSHFVHGLGRHVHLERFREAWEETTLHHDVLRGRMVSGANGSSYMVITKGPVRMHEMRLASGVQTYLEAQSKIPFGYRLPLLRLALVEDQDAQRHFVMSAHHSIYDGWSIKLVFNTFVEIYHGRAPAVPSTRFQHFAKQLVARGTRQSEDYWRRTLNVDGRGESLDEYPFPPIKKGTHKPVARASSSFSFGFSAEAVANHGVTPALLMQAAWALCLSQYSSNPAPTFGVVLSGRDFPMPGVEDIVGPMITTVPRRFEVDPSQSLGRFLQKVQAVAVEAAPHQHLGLHRIQSLSVAARQACDFLSLLVFNVAEDQGSPLDSIGATAIATAAAAPPTDLHPYPIALQFNIGEQRVDLEVHYDPECLEARMLEFVSKQIEHLVGKMSAASPETKLAALHKDVSPFHLEKMVEWNPDCKTPDADAPPLPCIHDLVSHWAKTTPSAMAVESHDATLTFAELDTCASHFASHIAQSVSDDKSPSVIIGACLEKSAAAIVTILAIIKSGYAYMPLNCDEAPGRIQAVVKQAGCRTILASEGQDRSLAETVPWCRVEAIDMARLKGIAGCPPDKTRGRVGSVAPDDPAYILMTSGTTGTPKLVLMTHGAWAWANAAHGSFYGFSSRTRALQYASYTFDSSLVEIFGVLTNGGCVVVPSESERRNDLVGFMRARSVTFTQLPPTVARLVPPGAVPTLECLGMGAEPVMAADVEPWVGSGVELLNLYGPSEACVVAVARRIDPSGGSSSGIISIGRPVGCNAWVVDPGSGAPCPVGAPGELWLSGPGLAQGYYADEHRTSQAFVQFNHPADGRVVRAYRTGDMARICSDGNIDFLGRRDSQIKLRGQRVDVGEIKHHVETFMRGKLQFRQAAVHFFKQANDDKSFLAAFIAVDHALQGKVLDHACVGITTAELGGGCGSGSGSGSGLVSTVRKLREYLVGMVPSYMIPWMFVFVNRMPETTAGKLNDKSLNTLVGQLLVQMATDPIEKTTNPLSATERTLRHWWAQVLDVAEDKIRADVDFFALGASSVSAIRLAAVARSHGQRLSYEDISRSPVLSDMAKRISVSNPAIQAPKPFELLPPNGRDEIEVLLAAHDISVDAVEDVYAATSLQRALLAATACSPGAYTMLGEMSIPRERLRQHREAWAAAASSFAPLRTLFISDPTLGLLQVVLEPTEMLQWQEFGHPREFIEHVRSQDAARTPLQLATIPAEEDVLVLFSMHHSIYDGRSLELLMHKLESHMAGRHDDSKPHVPFSVFVKYTMSLNMEEAKDFWRLRLSGFSGQKLPITASKKSNNKSKGQVLTGSLAVPMTESLSCLSSSTLSTVAHAAWALTLSHFTGIPDIAFGSTVSGRAMIVDQVADAASIFGPTVATIPLRFNIDYSSQAATFLADLKHAALDMEKHGQVGLDIISGIDESCKAACDFETIFNFQLSQQGGNNNPPPWRLVEQDHNFFTHPVAVDVQASKEGSPVRVALTHSPAVHPRYAASLLDTFVAIFRNLAQASPQARLCDIAALSPDHLSSLIEASGPRMASPSSSTSSPLRATVVELIRTRVELSPFANSLESWDGSLTYAALDDLSTTLAQKLVRLGVKHGDNVCFMLEKSKWAVVAMMGILKAGGCMVPCDPASKLSRLGYIVSATKAPLIITSPKCLPVAEELNLGRFVLGDETLPKAETAFLAPQLQTLARPEDAAYILFTSGSTGVPKGVVVQHQTLSSTLGELGVGMGLGPHTRCYQFNSFWFDIMLLDIFGPLVHGGCVCIPSEDQKLNDLTGSIAATRSDFVTLSTSISRLIEPEKVPSLTTICLGGEPVRKSDVDRWAHRSRLVAGYGPTEAYIICVMGDLSPTTDPSVIGRPVGCHAWVVNQSKHELAPFGAIGELVIQGPNLAAGYLDDEETTREAFLPCPAWIPDTGVGGRRMVYKTGDLVRWKFDGTLSYVGRKEGGGQVKIRGHRVELGEIEEAIRRQLPPCDTVAVDLVRHEESQRHVLCAVLGMKDPDPDPERDARLPKLRRDIDSAVRAALPPHMIPDVYLALAKIPTTSTGKLDRAALKEAIRPALTTAMMNKTRLTRDSWSPLSSREQRLAALWSRVLSLDLDVIGGCDNFFALGGDSIKAMKLVALARKNLVLNLSVAKIFAQPTLAGMAEAAAEAEAEAKPLAFGSPSEGVADGSSEPRQHVQAAQHTSPCTQYQATFLAGMMAFPGAHMTQHVFTLDRNVDITRLQSAVDACVTIFPALGARIITTSPDDGTIKQRLQPSGTTVWAWHEGQDLDVLLARDAARAWDLEHPLHHISVLKGPDGSSPTHLVWSMSHAAYDAACLAEMISSINQKYSNPSLEFPPPTLPFHDFVQQAAAAWDASRSFWSSSLSSLPTPELLFRYPTVLQPRQDAVASFRAQIPSKAMRSTTASCAVIAAWALVLARRQRQQHQHHQNNDVTIAHLTSGRTSGPDGVESCRGPTISKIPLRVRVPPPHEASVADVAALVARELAKLLPHQHSGIRAMAEFVPDSRTEQGGMLNASHAGAVFGRLPLDLAVHPPGYLSMKGGVDSVLVYERSIAVAPPPGGLSAECSLVQTDCGVEVDVLMIWDSRAAHRAEIELLVDDFRDTLGRGRYNIVSVHNSIGI